MLFDALERVLQGTPQATLVNDLFQVFREAGGEGGREGGIGEVSSSCYC